MQLLSLFSRQKRIVIDAPPADASLRRVRPRPEQRPVRARRAEADVDVDTPHGRMRARGGADYIVIHGEGDCAVVRGEIFERTYEPLGAGLYRKRADLVLRCFTIDRPAMVETLEGRAKAEPGDWVMIGVAGEMWPVAAEKAREKYLPAD